MTACSSDPQSIGNGHFEVLKQPGPPYPNGSFAVYRCSHGYVLSGQPTYSECTGGQWSKPALACVPTNSSNEILVWVLVGVASLVLLLILIFIIMACLYFCTRNRATVVQVQPRDDVQPRANLEKQQVSTKGKGTKSNVNNPGSNPPPHKVVRVQSAGTQMYEWEGASLKYADDNLKYANGGFKYANGSYKYANGIHKYDNGGFKYTNGKTQEPVPALSPLSNGSTLSNGTKLNNVKADVRTPPKWMPHTKIDR